MWRWQLKTCWSLLTDLIDVPTQNLLRLALLLMLMMKIVLATVCCILGSWGLVIKPNFCSDFQHKVSSRFWSWSSGRILKLEFGQYFAADVLQRLWRWILVKMLKQGLVNIFNFKFSRGGDVWCGFWSKCLVEILKMKFEQDLCLNLWYDPIGYFGKMNSTLGSVVPLAMFLMEWLLSEPLTRNSAGFLIYLKKLLWKPSQYALPKSYDDMRAEKTTFSRLSLVRGFLWHPSTGQNQAQPLLCSIRP